MTFCACLFVCALWLSAGRGLTFWLSLWCIAVSLSLLGQVWYLIVSIPDLCTLTYYDIASGSDIRPCIEIDKPLVVYIFSSVMS